MNYSSTHNTHVKLLEKVIKENLHDSGLGEEFLDMTQ